MNRKSCSDGIRRGWMPTSMPGAVNVGCAVLTSRISSHRRSKFFEGTRYELQAWVVMPNHVHAVLRPLPGWTLSRILKSWKGYTAREANKLLQRTGEQFWQTESFDHLVRNDEDMYRCCNYTTTNPLNARLSARPEEWKWSSVYRPAV